MTASVASKRYCVAFFDTYTNELTQVLVRSSDVKAALMLAAIVFYSSRSDEAKAECLAWLAGLLNSTDNMELIYDELWKNELAVSILEININILETPSCK